MPTYTDVFGGANIYPSEISYSQVTLSNNVRLSWPEETSANENLATRIMDVNPTVEDFSIFLPDAQKSSNGNTILFNNQGNAQFFVRVKSGTQLAAIAPGTVWQIYLTDNSSTDGQWEVLQFGASISQADASHLAGIGMTAIGTLLSPAVPVVLFNSNYTTGLADRAKMYVWNGAGSGNLLLLNAPEVGNNWFMYLRNAGGGQLTVSSFGTALIDGGTNKIYQPGDSSAIISDGTNFYTLGFGRSAVFVFDYTTISVAGNGVYTLSGSELNRIAYKFTGTLDGNRQVVVPSTVQQYWIDNSTVGPYTLTVKTASGAGAGITQGARGIYYCDGNNIVNADTASVSFPISVSQGGTGSNSASSALINLGGTSTGVSIFTAANANAVWAILGAAPAGVVTGGTF